jgi:cytochrome c oxidase subunit 6b
MPHEDYRKYKVDRVKYGNVPAFSDLNNPYYSFARGVGMGGGVGRQAMLEYFQWLHCIGNWGEDHSMCKKQRFFVEKMNYDFYLEKFDHKKDLGHFDYTILYGAAPWRGFVAQYQPVKEHRKGMYEYWQDRNFEPLFNHNEAGDWREKAPILHDIFVKGKKPIYDDE